MFRISAFTVVFLVLLRLAIGWHFLYEGLHKLHSIELGETSTNPRPFTSASYFRDAPGPFATFMRGQLGDPDAVAVAELTVEPVPAGEDVTRYPPRKRMPARWRNWPWPMRKCRNSSRARRSGR